MTALLCLLAVGQAVWAARVQGWTYDEPVHIAWTQRLLETREWERDSRWRFDSKTPIVLPGVLALQASRAAGVADLARQRFLARLPSVAWLIALLGLVWAFTRSRLGERAAVLATSACALDPNLVAHASLVTVDAACAATTLAALAAAVLFFERPSPARGGLLGAALGLAFTAKFSAVLLLAAIALVPLLDARLRPRRLRPLLLGLAAAAAAAWLVVAGAYLFTGMGQRLSDLQWRSRPLAAAASLFPEARLPVPAAVLTGLDRSLANERKTWQVVLFGRVHPQGIWYYFLVVWALKTPLLLGLTLLMGLARSGRALAQEPAARVMAAGLVLGALYFSFFFHAQVGYRYVLMLLPLAYILGAAGLRDLPSGRGPALALLAVCAASAAESLWYLGNPLAFTNVAVQPKRLAFRLLADSNLDWGQNRERIEAALSAARAGHTQLDPPHLMAGHNTFGVNSLGGVFGERQHEWVRQRLEPRGHFLHTYLWYEVDQATFDRFLEEARPAKAEPWMRDVCGDPAAWERQPAGARLPLSFTGSPGPLDGWRICLQNKRALDFGVRVHKGRLRFGLLRQDGSCDPLLVADRQVAWYRLDPGVHALCALAVPNRRAYIPYSIDATWLLRGRGAEMAVRPHVFAPPPPAAARAWDG